MNRLSLICGDWSASVSVSRFIEGANTIVANLKVGGQGAVVFADSEYASGSGECAGKELKQAETRLAALLNELGVDSNSPEEKAWEAYRDAQLKAVSPPVSDEQAEYGSVHPMCWATPKRKLTQGRIHDLQMLTTSEGDTCHRYGAGGNGK